MSCQHWKPILFDVARGLNSDQAREAMLHAKECPQCAMELDEQQQLNKKLKWLAAKEKFEDPNVPSVLITAFRKNQTSMKQNRRVLVFMRAAILVLAFVGGWIWYNSIDRQTPAVSLDQQDVQYDDEFIPLQYGNSPVNSMQVVRVKLGASDLQELGFPRVPEWEDRPIEADIVVAEDGLPEAIRFVNFVQQ
jgi:hypothetical protein